MMNTILTGVALMATTALAGPGSAIVINKCNYDVHLANTPASGGGFSAIDQILSPGGQYSQVYTQLTNLFGWSIKLSKDGNYASNLMQYEYTYHDDGTIWFDISEVNGNPWDGNWEITATNGCSPRQAAYRYSTDDAYGMQSCSDTASITVTLCSGTSSGGAPSSGGSSWGSSPAPAPSSAPSSAQSAAPEKGHSGHGHPHHSWGGFGGNKVAVESAPAADEFSKAAPTTSTPSTPSEEAAPTSSSDSWDGPAVTVTNLAFETVTQMVTATAQPKRHVHHPRHGHRA